MTILIMFLLLADVNPERRARTQIDAAAVAEKNAEAAYDKADLATVKIELKNVGNDIEAAQKALMESGKTPGRNPGPYKYAEQRSRELLIRLRDLEQKMDSEERELIAAPKAKVQEIHDEWLEGIMGRKR